MAKKPGLLAALQAANRGEPVREQGEKSADPEADDKPSAKRKTKAPKTAIGAGASSAKPGRVGRVNITGYFDPNVKQSIRLIQAKHPERTVQDLLAEALDLLFATYNVPQTARAGIEKNNASGT